MMLEFFCFRRIFKVVSVFLSVLTIFLCDCSSTNKPEDSTGHGDDNEQQIITIRDYYIFKDDGYVEPGGFWYDYPAFGPDGEKGKYRYGIEKTCAWTGVRNRPHLVDGKRSIEIYATEAFDHEGMSIPWHRNGFMHVVPGLNLESVTDLKFEVKVMGEFKGRFKIVMENGVYNSPFFPGGYPIDPEKPLEDGGYEAIYPYWSQSVDIADYGFDKNVSEWQTISIPVKNAFPGIDLSDVRSPFIVELTQVGDHVCFTNIRFENYSEYPSDVYKYEVESGTPGDVIKKYARKGYNLVWNDEFNGDSIDYDNWHVTKNGKVDEVTGLSGYGNNEWQSYNEDNVVVEDGKLKIISRFDSDRYYGPSYGVIPESDIHENGDRDSQYTSGRIFSKKKKEFKYGIIEASISLPFETGKVDPGYWPAFWILGATVQEKAWPMCGEIDIMERGGKNSGLLFATCHFGDSWEDWTYNKPDNYISSHNSGNFSEVWGDDFHVYSLEWTEDSLKWYFDGEMLLEFNNRIHEEKGYSPTYPQYGGKIASDPMSFFQDYFYIVINAAVGVSNPNNDCASAADYRSYQEDKVMMVDWVRVYQK